MNPDQAREIRESGQQLVQIGKLLAGAGRMTLKAADQLEKLITAGFPQLEGRGLQREARTYVSAVEAIRLALVPGPMRAKECFDKIRSMGARCKTVASLSTMVAQHPELFARKKRMIYLRPA